MEKLSKKEFATSSDFNKYEIGLKLARRLNEKVSDGCLLVWNDKSVLDGLISFSQDGICGFGMKFTSGKYMHICGAGVKEEVEEGKSVVKYVLPQTEDEIKAIFAQFKYVKQTNIKSV